MLIKDQFGIIQNFQTSPIPQTSFLPKTLVALYYSNTTQSIFRRSTTKNPAPYSYLLMDTPYLKQVVVLSQQGMCYCTATYIKLRRHSGDP